MALSTSRSTQSTIEEHVADHNTLHGFYNAYQTTTLTSAPLFIGSVAPVVVSGPYMWVEIVGEDFTFWIEDGVVV